MVTPDDTNNGINENLFEEALSQIEMTEDIPEGDRVKARLLIKRIVENNISLKDAMGVSQDLLEGVYAIAYRLYNSGKYNEAKPFFRLLAQLDGDDSRFSMGLAACYHMDHDYEKAMYIYHLSALQNFEDPRPYFHMSDCYIRMGQPHEAIIALENMLDRVRNKPSYSPLFQKALLTLKALRNQVKKEEQQVEKTDTANRQ